MISNSDITNAVNQYVEEAIEGSESKNSKKPSVTKQPRQSQGHDKLNYYHQLQ